MGAPDRSEQAALLSRARVIVSGRVQGVFFRQTCAREAHDAGLTGSVINRADGRVEAVFQGPRPSGERLIDWCRTGPPAARVDGIDVSWEDPDGGAEGFHVGWS